jgi:hypothetical protein
MFVLVTLGLHIMSCDGKFRGHCVSDTVVVVVCKIMLLADELLALEQSSIVQF